MILKFMMTMKMIGHEDKDDRLLMRLMDGDDQYD